MLGEAQNLGANMSALSSKVLADLLHTPDIMQKIKIIDCSPAVSHNTSHIQTSNHFLCTAITLRRYSSTTLLKHILTEGKLNSFLSNELTHVILYNANGSRCLAVKKALHALQTAKESVGLSTQICILSGGFEKFKSEYPYFCVSQNSASKKASSTSSARTLWVSDENDSLSNRGATGDFLLDYLSVPKMGPFASPDCPGFTFDDENQNLDVPKTALLQPTQPANSKVPQFSSAIGTERRKIQALYRHINEPIENCENNGKAPVLSPLREIISPLLNVTANENCETSPTRVVSGIYLGSASHASRQQLLNNLGITAILNISKRVPNFFPDYFIYKRIEIEDSNSESLTEFFNVSNCFIDSILLTGGKVLIHCQEGISRSPSVCIAYLMSSRRMRLNAAFDAVYSKRPLINPNLNFMCQLLEYEKSLMPDSPTKPPRTAPPIVFNQFIFPEKGSSENEQPTSSNDDAIHDTENVNSECSPKQCKIPRRSCEPEVFVF